MMQTIFLVTLLILQHHLMWSQEANDLEANIDNWRKHYNIPQVGVGIIENGIISDAKVYSASDTKGSLNNENLQFDIASLTKPVFATLVLKLVDLGLWDLDTPLFKFYIDDEVKDDERLKLLTSKHVLSHCSGFPNWRDLTPSGKLQLHFEPGEKYLYSGEGYEYLRIALEKKFNTSLQDLAKEYLYDPARMLNSQFGSAAGGLRTTISDYTSFSNSLLNHQIVSSDLFEVMVEPQVAVKKGIEYGLGWEVVPQLQNNEYAIMHSGSDPGTQTFVLLFPKSKNGIIVFTNSDSGDKLYRKIIESYSELGKEVMNRLYAPFIPESFIELPVNLLKEYSGTYRLDLEDEVLIIDIFIENDELMAKFPSLPRSILYAQSENYFEFDESFAFKFVRGSDNRVSSMIIYQSGIESYVGRKE